jgi:nucleoid-associated protein YgaU
MAMALQNPNVEELKRKYHSVISFIQEQPGASLKNVHIENGKLLIRATVPSEDSKNRVWDKIKMVDPKYDDLATDFIVQPSEQGTAEPAARKPPQSYTVKAGDTLSKISKELYGDANQHRRIFEANRDQLQDPNMIHPGQVLKIPA